MSKDYRVTVKVRNNRILKAIETVGGTPGGKWCEENGLTYSFINDLINMTVSPLTANGELRRQSLLLCDVLNKLPEDLWSNQQLYPLEKNFSEMEMDHEQVIGLLPSEEQSYLPDFSNLERAETRKLIDGVLETLTEREVMVIKFRFEHDFTLDEVADRLGIGRERVWQIEAKALRKLRHPKRVDMYLDCLDLSDEKRAEHKRRAKVSRELA